MKILVAYDKNMSASKVMDEIADRAGKFGADIYLVRTCDPDIEKFEIEQLESELEGMGKKAFKEKGISYETHILIRGLSPGEDIVKFASENSIDEIIIGIKKKSKIGKLVFGSTAQFVVLEAHCPVLCVK